MKASSGQITLSQQENTARGAQPSVSLGCPYKLCRRSWAAIEVEIRKNSQILSGTPSSPQQNGWLLAML